MKNALLISLLLCAVLSNAQNRNRFLDPIDNLPQEISKFVPEGYVAIDTVSGDLNRDAIPDLILVAASPDEEEIDTADFYRPLIILTGNKDGTYTQAGRNDKVVYGIADGGMMGDPFMGVVIKEGCFTVQHYGGSAWRWENDITFLYSEAKKGWLLHKEEDASFHAPDAENREETIRTVKDFGVIPFEEYRSIAYTD